MHAKDAIFYDSFHPKSVHPYVWEGRKEDRVPTGAQIFIVGAGPVGLFFADELASRLPQAQIVIAESRSEEEPGTRKFTRKNVLFRVPDEFRPPDRVGELAIFRIEQHLTRKVEKLANVRTLCTVAVTQRPGTGVTE